MAVVRIRRNLLLFAAITLFSGSVHADADATPSGERRLALRIADAASVAQQHVRYAGAGAVCENLAWDGAGSLGEVTQCEAIGERYWRRGTIDLDLMLTRFAFLSVFLVSTPRPQRAVASEIGILTLYAFQLEDMPGHPSGCNGFVRGYDASGTGFRAYLLGYFCADRGALDPRTADGLLRGLSLRGVFPSLLP